MAELQLMATSPQRAMFLADSPYTDSLQRRLFSDPKVADMESLNCML